MNDFFYLCVPPQKKEKNHNHVPWKGTMSKEMKRRLQPSIFTVDTLVFRAVYQHILHEICSKIFPQLLWKHTNHHITKMFLYFLFYHASWNTSTYRATLQICLLNKFDISTRPQNQFEPQKKRPYFRKKNTGCLYNMGHYNGLILILIMTG